MNTIQIIEKEKYAIVQLDRGKANAINFEMVQELREAFKLLSKREEIKGAVLTGKPHFFSAGLDLVELMQYNTPQMDDFFVAFGSLYTEMLRFKKPIIAAITGHSPAGGCVLAVTCDNRYMADGDNYVIGLNEVAVNVQISQDLVECYAYWIGRGLAHRYILEGKLLNGQEALSCGLVDELLPLEEVLPRAEKQMQHYLKADEEILGNTKAKLRKPLLNNLASKPENTMDQTAKLWWKPEIRAKMMAYVAHFTNKKK
ncbi:MAG: enoyl-CoA hydratase/isomerase family protein [Bacteroidota bacterium]